jgi:hypothetical protein
MTILNYLQRLQAAGLPVINADDSGAASFSREFSTAEKVIFLDIADEAGKSVRDRLRQSRITAKAIPSWATWTQADWDAYFTANLSPTQVTTVTTIAIARTMLNRQNLVIQNLVKLVIALRDAQFPDL